MIRLALLLGTGYMAYRYMQKQKQASVDALTKGKVIGWLPQWDEVLAYVTAPENNGGTGAVYVLLAR